MKETYGNYYKIFGCACKNCGCDEKPIPRAVSGAQDTLCEDAKSQFYFEPADCNDCIIERVGFADAYVPYQTEFAVMCPEKSLVCGTAFAVLAMPYTRSVCNSDSSCNCKSNCKTRRGMNG
ncbi:MAG: spore coat associated protein CotJA [Clostridia bacterium]|jgi:hypothetical protein|nr:spore coat associated protein CotJA [Clostridia bacterium]